MQSTITPIARDIVFIGGGHSHVGVLRQFGMHPEPGVRLTVICTDVHTPYSGMLPGYVAGHYSYDDAHIDLARLAQFAGARLYRDTVVGIDRAARTVLCANRPPVAYDCLSINIGSAPAVQAVLGAEAFTTPVKPITRFNARWLALLARVQEHSEGVLRIAVVGAGAGGVELLLAMQFRLEQELALRARPASLLAFHLLGAGQSILPTHSPTVQRKFAAVLAERRVQVHLNANVVRVEAQALYCANGTVVQADEMLWVTQAAGASWLGSTGLALDERGFVRVNERLQTLSDPLIFAAGDTAAMEHRPLEKAGVFAVRMGPVLADNLRHTVRGEALRAYRPQRRWLALISTGDRYAVASRGALAFWGTAVWTWKDWIDRRFMRRFSEFPAPQTHAAHAMQSPVANRLDLSAVENQQALSAVAMRCGGCGAKVGASVLARALSGLPILPHPDVLVGLQSPDDAAVVRIPPGKALVLSVDFFRAFVDDPYLFGQIAANHALGDLFAMGAAPHTATAIATVPPGLEAKVEELLRQMMLGAVQVLTNAGCALVGGHTGEGAELALGFAVQGLVDETLVGVTRKGGMRPGDVLVLTKALGTGTLFAAHAQLAAKGRWIDGALQSMVQSNQRGAQCLREWGATACTDVTGFGLLGHALEMTRASGVDLEIQIDALPVLNGAQETLTSGLVSSLHAANLLQSAGLRNPGTDAMRPRYPLLFDPQTAGGLLASVPAERVQSCITALRALGYCEAAVVGRVLQQQKILGQVVLTD